MYTTVVPQQCVIERQKHNEVKFRRKNTTKLGFQNTSHIHILFTMLIILNITTNRLTASTTSKTSYMLDFHKFFSTWINAEKTWKMRKTRGKRRKSCGKRGKSRGKLRNRKIFSRTRCDVDGIHADTAQHGRQFQNADAARRGRVLFAHL